MFAKVLHKSMKGLGTDDESLLRVVISRCECDMVQIKEAFQRDYKQTLGQFIAVSGSSQTDVTNQCLKYFLNMLYLHYYRMIQVVISERYC